VLGESHRSRRIFTEALPFELPHDTVMGRDSNPQPSVSVEVTEIFTPPSITGPKPSDRRFPVRIRNLLMSVSPLRLLNAVLPPLESGWSRIACPHLSMSITAPCVMLGVEP